MHGIHLRNHSVHRTLAIHATLLSGGWHVQHSCNCKVSSRALEVAYRLGHIYSCSWKPLFWYHNVLGQVSCLLVTTLAQSINLCEWLQIALLLQGIFTVKMDYNERFLALRDVKQAVCAELQHKYNELVKLNTQLGINDVVQPPCMRPSEEPERREEVTDEDIKAFISAQEAAAESAAANNLDGFAGGGGGGGSGGAGGDKGATGDAQGKPQAQGADSKAPDKGGKTKDTPRKAAGETVEALVARLSAQYPPTPMEKTQRALMERKWVCCLCW